MALLATSLPDGIMVKTFEDRMASVALRRLCGSAGLSIQIACFGIPYLALILCIRAVGMRAECEIWL